MADRFQTTEGWQTFRFKRAFLHVGGKRLDEPAIRIEQTGRHDTFEQPRRLQHHGQQVGGISDWAEELKLRRVSFQLQDRHRMKQFAVAAGDLFADFGAQLQAGEQDGRGQSQQRNADQDPRQPPRAQEQLFDLRNSFHASSHRASLRWPLICCGDAKIAMK